MRSNFERLSVEIFGESHAEKIGVRLAGIPAGTELTLRDVGELLKRRKGGAGAWSTSRAEADVPEFVSGLERVGEKVRVTGEIIAQFTNSDVRSSDYDVNVPRPSHADYAAYAKDGRIAPGGGRFSGRMTAPLCVAGGIAKELLRLKGINVGAYIARIGEVALASYAEADARALTEWAESEHTDAFPTLSGENAERAKAEIARAAAQRDSVGGVIECVVSGVRAGGMGDALFEGLEGKLAYSLFAVPAVKGVEFGGGFDMARLRGSEANDAFAIEDGKVVTATNLSGGINGGIANGMPITLRVAMRPTPSIGREQQSVELDALRPTSLSIRGRHDACIVPRAVPCIESAVALALLDEALKWNYA